MGKSLLAEILVQRTRVPHVFATATAGATSEVQRAELLEAVAGSNLAIHELGLEARADSWRAALRQLAAGLPADQPPIVVLDEVPCLTGAVSSFEGALQVPWRLMVLGDPSCATTPGEAPTL